MIAGRTRTNKIVTFPDSGERKGTFVSVRIERARLHSLDGEVTSNLDLQRSQKT
jgi:tRNA A37 methylthiotransferase MiaB